jgi:hypothetical protein
VVAVFAAAVLLQVVAAQGARQDAQLAVPQAWEPEQDVPQAVQFVGQAARQDAPPVPGELLALRSDAWLADLPADSVAAHLAESQADPRVALPVPDALPALRSDAWLADLQADSVAVHLAESQADPQAALLVPGALLAARSAALLADPRVALPVLDALLELRSDVLLADLLDGRPDDYLAARLADDHSWPAAASQAVWR